jgi:predicted TIM-barrel fold metal-dependent hydrolase
MNVHAGSASSQQGAQKLGIIDCDIHPVMRSPGELKKYLSPDWHEHLDTYGTFVRQPFVNGDIYPRAAPYLSRRDAMPPNGGPPGSDLEFMREQLLDLHNVEIGVLQVLGGGTHQRNIDYGAALSSAINDWQVAEWLDRDDRLRGSISITQEFPEGAAREIRRHGPDKRFAQIGMSQRSLEPAGRRRYWPIYEAAVEFNLTLGIHTGGYNGHAPVPGGGWPSFYAEQHHLINVCQQNVLSSLVMEGVFEQFPTLRVVLVEGGFTWAPALTWRLDNLWEKMRSETPRVKRPPSEYIKQHVWFTTQPVDDMGSPERLRKMCELVGWDRLCFSSDYPHWDFDDPRFAFTFRLKEEERLAVFNRNARNAYHLR